MVQQLAVRGERLRVTADGASQEIDAPSARLGPLQLHRTVEGWALRDTGTDHGPQLEVLPVVADEPMSEPPPEPP